MGLMDIIKGAGGGAMTGGSIGGPWGAAIGAGAGGLLSLLGGGPSEEEQRMEEYRKQIMNRQAPQLGPISNAATSDFRGNQQGLVQRLEAMANGQGPSLAGEQLKAATDRNMAQQSSIAQSGRGNATLANLVAANNMQNLGQGAAQQAAAARIGEQQMALGQLGGAIQGGRGQDEALGQFNAQQNNFGNQANLEAKLRTMGLNDAAILNVMNQQTQQANRPGLGDQLLAGGTGALGFFASQNAQSKANAGSAAGSPVGGGGRGFNMDNWYSKF